MKPSLFDPLDSHQLLLAELPMGSDPFEQEKIAYPEGGNLNQGQDQRDIIKTPKSKKIKKLTDKDLSEDNRASKISKIKEKKIKSTDQDKQKNPNQSVGHWSFQENKKYHWFLQMHHTHFMNRSLRRMDRIFTSMAKFVNSRQAEQCRSHHQKMQKKHIHFSRILLSLRMNYYESYDAQKLIQELDRNELKYDDGLLTQKQLTQCLILKDSSHELQISKEQGRPQKASQSKQKGKTHQINTKNTTIDIPVEQEQILQMIAPQIESSKNYYYRFLSDGKQRNDILDDGYESNLPFGHLF